MFRNSEVKRNSATLAFEVTLWQAADKMRGHMDPSEYKHVVLGLIFLKYISDAFEERWQEIEKELTDPNDAWHVGLGPLEHQYQTCQALCCPRRRGSSIRDPCPSR